MKITAKNIVFIFVCVLLLVSATRAQERRTILVSVMDKKGNIVEGLTAANFRGEFRGKGARILTVTEDVSPRKVAIAVDVSPSTDWGDRATVSWLIAELVVLSVAPEGQVRLVTFNDEFILEQDFTSDVATLKKKLLELAAMTKKRKGTPTAFFDAMYAVGKEFSVKDEGAVIYTITDGVDNNSYVVAKKVEAELVRRGVRVFVFCLPKSSKDTTSSECKRFPLATGGILMPSPNLNRVTVSWFEKHLQPFHESIERLFKLEIELPRTVDKPRKWKLEVVDERGEKMKGVEVFYPRLLVPLEAPPEK